MPDTPAWRDLATQALHHSIHRATHAAHQCVQKLVDRFGPKAMPAVLIAWIDTMLNVRGRNTHDKPVAVAWQREGTDTLTTADDVTPALRWAGRLVAARAADDETQARALLNSVADNAQWTANIAAVLEVCGTSIRVALSQEVPR